MRPTSPAVERSLYRGGSPGFALLETVLALAVLGLVAAVVLPSSFAGRSRSLDLWQSAGSLCSLLRQDRNAALASRTSVRTTVDAGRRLVVSGATRRTLALGSDTHLAVEGPAKAGAIDFRADGSASGARLRLSSGGKTVMVTVNDQTGAVTVARLR